IRLVTYAGSSYHAAPLVLADGVNAVTTDLWMLPPRPLQGLTDLPLYLISLVDERFFWWFKASNFFIAAGSTTWTQLFAALPAAVDVVYPVAVAGVPAGDISYQVTLASLLLPDFTGITGKSGDVKTFHSSATANGTGTPSNNAELVALATQIATDFYRWQCGR